MAAYGRLLLAPGGPFGPSLATDAWGALHKSFLLRLGYPHAKFLNKGSKTKQKKTHFDGFNPQWGGGFRSESTFHVFFLLLM